VRRSAATAIQVPLVSDRTLRQSLAPCIVTGRTDGAGPGSLEPAVGATGGHLLGAQLPVAGIPAYQVRKGCIKACRQLCIHELHGKQGGAARTAPLTRADSAGAAAGRTLHSMPHLPSTSRMESPISCNGMLWLPDAGQ
jgi:hypothetical protein